MADRNYLCFTANTAGSTVSTILTGTLTTTPTLEYSVNDGVTWSNFVIGSTTVTLVNTGDKVYLRGNNSSFSESSSNYINFTMSGSISASGNVMSLLDKTCQSVILSDYCFVSLFRSCVALTRADNLILPATTLTLHCYKNMFLDCTSLITTPTLPATTLANGCYDSMFYRCTSLTTAPELPATTLTESCYGAMFYGCTSLTIAPELPATTLANNCYYTMFRGCTNIKLSTTQTGQYKKPYRIPTSGTGTTATNALYKMFTDTGGTFTDTPSINTTYYLWVNPPTTYIGVSNVAKKVKDIYIGISNKAKKVKKAYIGVNGVAKLFYQGEQLIPFASSPVPTGWVSSTYTDAYNTNTYGEWTIKADNVSSNSYPVWNAFDGNTSTRYSTTNKSSNDDVSYVYLTCPEGVTINPTQIYVVHMNCGNTTVKCSFEASENNTTWESLVNLTRSADSVTDTLAVSTTKYYRYFRLKLSRYSSSYKSQFIYEFQIKQGTLKIG